ncbi:hypothetical protein C9374_002146 [Naegleria lovaniensis]|uniref:Cyclin N-terminal domain-containing protein n=1 Tax=Naegleria lovaniensis TaxID=51637 RepID=A0AA88GWB4_NAELO|nr:uncharacterized protein C9374_002146 [Naegleria lovaniensis]KAG2387111.1 hypothetical protein C9374_002146 [Naegleria lovaniensis]
MEIACFYHVPMLSMEKEMLKQWNEQMEWWDEFCSFLHRKPALVEAVMKISLRADLRPTVKYNALMMIYQYVKISKETENLVLLTLVCIRIQVKRVEAFTIAPKSIIDIVHHRQKSNANLTEKDINELEMKILETLNFEINFVSVFEFVELYAACFWNLASERLNLESKIFMKAAEQVCDVLYLSASYLVKQKNPKLLSGAIIACASEVKCGKKLAALNFWISHVTGEDDDVIQKHTKELFKLLQED